jgi:hypothetical protein
MWLQFALITLNKSHKISVTKKISGTKSQCSCIFHISIVFLKKNIINAYYIIDNFINFNLYKVQSW